MSERYDTGPAGAGAAPLGATSDGAAGTGPTGGAGTRDFNSTWSAVRRDVDRLVDAAAAQGKELTLSAQQGAGQYVEGRKNALAYAVDDLGRSLRETSASLADQPNLRAYVDAAADGLDGLSAQIRAQSLGDLYDDASAFARQRPIGLLIGATAFGLLLSRFLKAGTEEKRAMEVRARYERGRFEPEAPPAAGMPDRYGTYPKGDVDHAR